MTYTTTPPYLSATQLNRQMASKFEHDFQYLSAELSSGGESANYGAVSDVKYFLNQEVMLDGVTRYQEGNRLSREKINSMSMAFGVMRDTLGDFQEQLSLARSLPPGTPTMLSSWVNSKLQYLNSVLSSTFNGQYLFSGAATNSSPVTDLSALPPVAINDPVDFSYYVGSTTPTQFNATDTDVISMDIYGNDQGIAELIMALRTCKQLQPTQSDAQIAQAMNLCKSSLQNLINTQCVLDFKGVTIDKIEDELSQLKQNLEDSVQKVGYRSQTDIFQEFVQTKTSLALSNYVTTSALNAIRDLVDRMPI